MKLYVIGFAGTVAGFHLKLNFCESAARPVPRCVNVLGELQKPSESMLFGSGAESTRLIGGRNVFDGFPERTNVFTVDLELYDSSEKLEGDIEGDGTTTETCTDHYANERQNIGSRVHGSRSASKNVMNRSYVIGLLTKCVREGNFEIGKLCHGLVIKNGYGDDRFVGTDLVNMYAKCGDMDSATIIFERILDLDIVSCNCLISGYAGNMLFDEALGFFQEIQIMGIRPNHYTYSILLSVCGTLLAIQEGRQFHAHVVKMHYLSENAVGNALLTMYCKCGMMRDAEMLFDSLTERNVVSWTTLISGFYQHKAFEKAFKKFCKMKGAIKPNQYTFSISIACCGGMEHLDNGRALHAQVIKNGMASGVHVGTAILDMYSKLGNLNGSSKQLQEMGRNASNVPWNAFIVGLVQNEKIEEAIEAFHKMVWNDVPCDEFTYSITLKACASLPSLSACRQIHSQVIKGKFDTNFHVGGSLIEAYAKCGTLKDAEQVFDLMSSTDVVSWNSMIKAYSQYGYPRKAVNLFRKMIERGEKPSGSTFLAVLSACSHSGLLEQGQEFFNSMVSNYRITPEDTHYSCMVDLLSRKGKLEKALDFITSLPISRSAAIWRPLLAACRYHGNLQLAEVIAKRILELDANDATVYVTLSNMYAEAGRLADAEKQRELMELKEIRKQPGCSWMEVNNTTYKFFSGDKTHADMPKVYKKLKQLIRQIKDIGYTPSEISVLHPESECDDEGQTLHHSEKLAVCFGIINLSAGTPIRVFKNLRVCSDCHSATKLISVVTKRDIILRDNYRFHHFKEGHCSCADFW